MISNIPTYRAKMINSDEYVVGNYIKTQNKYYIYEDGTSDIYLDDEECFDDGSIDGEIRIIDLIFEIDATTLSIHFPDMIDNQGNKIFASLSEDGKGGDIVEGKCRDVNGDTITRLHKPLPYKGLVRFYKETLMSVVIETKDEIIEKTKGWSTPIYVNRGKALRWCDCRQDIKVIGIQE